MKSIFSILGLMLMVSFASAQSFQNGDFESSPCTDGCDEHIDCVDGWTYSANSAVHPETRRVGPDCISNEEACGGNYSLEIWTGTSLNTPNPVFNEPAGTYAISGLARRAINTDTAGDLIIYGTNDGGYTKTQLAWISVNNYNCIPISIPLPTTAVNYETLVFTMSSTGFAASLPAGIILDDLAICDFVNVSILAGECDDLLCVLVDFEDDCSSDDYMVSYTTNFNDDEEFFTEDGAQCYTMDNEGTYTINYTVYVDWDVAYTASVSYQYEYCCEADFSYDCENSCKLNSLFLIDNLSTPQLSTNTYQWRLYTPGNEFLGSSSEYEPYLFVGNGFVLFGGSYIPLNVSYTYLELCLRVVTQDGCISTVCYDLSVPCKDGEIGHDGLQETIPVEEEVEAMFSPREFIPIKVSPNPASDNIGLSFNLEYSQLGTIELVNAQGEVVKKVAENERWEKGENQKQIDIALPAGLYFVRLTSGSKLIAVEKFIVM